MCVYGSYCNFNCDCDYVCNCLMMMMRLWRGALKAPRDLQTPYMYRTCGLHLSEINENLAVYTKLRDKQKGEECQDELGIP